ncbi:MAG: folate/biopterin family MFS transporter [Deltaproteobacteria bacterium]|nr:folate/biopterin family MFS transporter [Deltaproteobacteria bacterium]
MNTERAESTNSNLRNIKVGVTVAIFVTVFASASRLAELPIRAVVKDELMLPPEAMAQFVALVGLPWYLKPIAGVLSDQVRLFGTRRKHYLMLAGVGGALTWILSALGPMRVAVFLSAMVLLNLMAVLGNTVAGGLLVEQARRHRATGRLSALRVVAMNAASLIAGPFGGWLAGSRLPAHLHDRRAADDSDGRGGSAGIAGR